MIRASNVRSASKVTGCSADSISLTFDDRHRRRIAMTTDGGLEFLLDLPEVPSLKDGDALMLEDGRLIAVKAAPERLLEISCADPVHLARISWHLGNRHLAAEIGEQRLLIRYDHVIAEMVRGLGATATEVNVPFNPEGGAYGHGRKPGRGDHTHD